MPPSIKTKLESFKKSSHVHLIGICGTAMTGLAGLLKKRGYRVTGSDQNFYPPMSSVLEKLKIPIFKGYKAKNLKPFPDFVIVGNVAQRKFPEIKALLKSNIPFTSLPQALHELILKKSQCIVVTGTHGKTSTTSLMSWIAESIGVKPGFLIGGAPKNFSYSFQWPKFKELTKSKNKSKIQNPWFIIEGDEYDTAFFDKVPKFNHYNAKHLILTSLEFDHADIYKDLKSIKKVFLSLLNKLPKDGWVVANAEDKNVMDVVKRSQFKKVFTYGLNQGDYQLKNRKVGFKQSFSVTQMNKVVARIQTSSIGIHNALNTLAAFVMARELKWPKRKTIQAIKSFLGVKKRQEVLVKAGEKVFPHPNKRVQRVNGKKNLKEENRNLSHTSPITLMRDFAHHPTAVKVTLDALKESFPTERIIVIFEPRSFSSRKDTFQKKYTHSFQSSDIAIIAPTYKVSQIHEKNRFSSKKLVEDINRFYFKRKKTTRALFLKNSKSILKLLKNIHQKKDLIIVMSNGSFNHLEKLILEESRNWVT